jgi:hypothetical protein
MSLWLHLKKQISDFYKLNEYAAPKKSDNNLIKIKIGKNNLILIYTSSHNSSSRLKSHLNVFDWNQIVAISRRLKLMAEWYSKLIHNAFAEILSERTIQYINERLRVTIDRCGFTPIANHLVHVFQESDAKKLVLQV